MTSYYMFITDPDGYSREVPVDPAHIDRQKHDYEAAGYTVTILDEDERIKFGLLTQQLREKPRGDAE